MASLEVGTLFSSYEELKARVDEYQSQNSLNLTIRGSTTIEATKKRFPTRNLNEALKYYELYFTCSDCTKYKSWNKSVNNVEIDGVSVRVAATKDGQHLEIRRINGKHNHPTAGSSRTPTKKKNIVQHDLFVQKSPSNSSKDVNTVRGSGRGRPRGRGGIPKANLKRKLNESLPNSIILGKQIERWQSLKQRLDIHTDDEFEEVILNHLEKAFEIQTSREVKPLSIPPFLPGRQLSTLSTSIPIGKIKVEEGTVQDNHHALTNIKGEYFSDLPFENNDGNDKYKHSHVSDQQEREYFPDQHEINYENHKYKHSHVSPALIQSEMKPQVLSYYMPQQNVSSPLQMPQRQIKPL